jgi:hypothetical protein
VLACEFEADAGGSQCLNTPPSVHVAGPNTPLAPYLLPLIGKRVGLLAELGFLVVNWLIDIQKLSVEDLKLQRPGAAVVRPSPHMVSVSPSTS